MPEVIPPVKGEKSRERQAPARRIRLWPRPGLRDLTPLLLDGAQASATDIRARDWAYVLSARGFPYVRLDVPAAAFRPEPPAAEPRMKLTPTPTNARTSPSLPASLPTAFVPSRAGVMGIVAGLWACSSATHPLFRPPVAGALARGFGGICRQWGAATPCVSTPTCPYFCKRLRRLACA